MNSLGINNLGLKDYEDEVIHAQINGEWVLVPIFKYDEDKYYVKIDGKIIDVDLLYEWDTDIKLEREI